MEPNLRVRPIGGAGWEWDTTRAAIRFPGGACRDRSTLSYLADRLPGADFRNRCNQLDRHGLVELEADRPLLDLIGCKGVSQRLDDDPRRRVDRIMLLPAREVDDGSAVQLVGRELVGNRFFD